MASTLFFMEVKFKIITFIMFSSLIAIQAITYAVHKHYQRHHQTMPSSLVLASTATFICDLFVSLMAFILPFQSLSKIHNPATLLSSVISGFYTILFEINTGLALIIIACAFFIIFSGFNKYALSKKTKNNRKMSETMLLFIGMIMVGCLLGVPVNNSYTTHINAYNLEAEYRTNSHVHKRIIHAHPKNHNGRIARHAIIHYNGSNNHQFMRAMNR